MTQSQPNAVNLFVACLLVSQPALAETHIQTTIQRNEQVFRQECLKIDSIFWVIPELRTTLEFDCSNDKVWLANQALMHSAYTNAQMRDSEFRSLEINISTARLYGEDNDVSTKGGLSLMQEISADPSKPALETLDRHTSKGVLGNK